MDSIKQNLSTLVLVVIVVGACAPLVALGKISAEFFQAVIFAIITGHFVLVSTGGNNVGNSGQSQPILPVIPSVSPPLNYIQTIQPGSEPGSLTNPNPPGLTNSSV